MRLAARMAAVGLCAVASAQARSPDAAARTGDGPWLLETYAPDVTILRTPPPRTGSDEIGWFLSCSGTESRLRLTLPSAPGGSAPRPASGVLMIRSRDPSVRNLRVVAPVRLAGDAVTIVESGGASRHAVRDLTDMLGKRPGALELLIGVGRVPGGLAQLKPYQVSLSFGPGASVLFDQFAAACARGAAGRTR